jgi:hypothetical protein
MTIPISCFAKPLRIVSMSMTFALLVMCLAQCKKESSAKQAEFQNPLANPADGPPAGYANGNYAIPLEAAPEDVSQPTHIIGTGTPESVTEQAFIDAVAQGGVIVFNGGSKPFTLTLNKPAKVVNDANPKIVIDGGGLVTLSGGGKSRILYMNTCDPNQHWATSHCQNQDFPQTDVTKHHLCRWQLNNRSRIRWRRGRVGSRGSREDCELSLFQ